MNTYMLRKLLRAGADLYKSMRRPERPRVIMTLLVKNEEQMLEQNLLFHKNMGVDAFIVTDNNSTDGTPGIIRRYVAKGWIVEAIEERAEDYEQKRWVDRMIWLAKTRHGADWVVNADADEFWYSPAGSLKAEMTATGANVLACEMRSVYPEEDRPWQEWARTVRAVPDQAAYGLSPYSIFERQNKKVMHRTDGYVQISMGNHKVHLVPQRERRCGVVVYHYNVRGRRQFVEKMVNGGRQLEQHKGRHGGRHWRHFYALWKEGRLDEEYDRVVGTAALPRLMREGYLVDEPEWPRLLRQYSAAPADGDAEQ